MAAENELAAPPAEAAARLEQVVAEHQAGLLRYAARFLNSAEAAQDVVQEVFIRFCRSWNPAACPAERLRFWLYSLAHNVAVDYCRRESRRRKLHEEQAALAADPGGRGEAERRHRLVLDHLDRLDPAERQVLLLRLQHGFSYREIAETTNRTEGNVGCLLHHAVKKMSRILKSQGVM
ncbi:MAG: sigma-70 family RNA polymerase sigma factor [Lentisphaeria bacterium]|jgi:RNA polymerase sigma-70 factor (ECF subfamily)